MSGFVPPPYPYARLAGLARAAQGHEGGMVDLSVGTPCDPAPRAVIEKLSESGNEHGYPSSAGSEALRASASGWIERRFGVSVPPGSVAACVGTKEFVASAAWYLRLRDGARDTVLVPEVAYPTYAMGAQLAGCKVFEVPESPRGTDVSAVPEDVARRALLLWVNSPSNPTGSLSDLSEVAAWGREHDVPVFSDECYSEFTWEPNLPQTVLSHGFEGVLAVHSLSKRSNMAGLRVGFYAGDPDLVGYLSSVRQHAGLMVAGPVQSAAVVALDDDEHVAAQRARYRARLERLVEVLGGAGLEAQMPKGGFYLWLEAPAWAREAGDGPPDLGARPAPSWLLAEALAHGAGALVSPGDLYGERARTFVRIAVVQPDERIELLAKRLAGARLDEPPAREERRELHLR